MLEDASPDRIAGVMDRLPSEIEVVVFGGEVDAFWSEADPAGSARALRGVLQGAP
jgi:hypothetical protein